MKFEDFLMEKHAEDYIGLDDDMPDAFNDWLENIDIENWLDYGDAYHKQALINVLTKIRDIANQGNLDALTLVVQKICLLKAQHKEDENE